VRAFALPSDHSGYVRLNVRGRERLGAVDPADVEAVAAELEAGLLTFRDPDGAPSVRRVDRLEAHGGGADRLPDLLVRWSDHPSARLPWLESPRFGRVGRVGVGVGRTGGHELGGWALLVPGRSRPREGPADIVDVAATALAHAGGSPDELPGRPLLEPSDVTADDARPPVLARASGSRGAR
jgi:predicted AlkP superfamily phosphohydrolase/phosphomutase